jgi:hypothetical protein
MKLCLSIILLAFTLFTPLKVISADKANDIKALSENFERIAFASFTP